MKCILDMTWKARAGSVKKSMVRDSTCTCVGDRTRTWRNTQPWQRAGMNCMTGLHYIIFHFISFQYITLITLHYIALHCIHYITKTSNATTPTTQNNRTTEQQNNTEWKPKKTNNWRLSIRWFNFLKEIWMKFGITPNENMKIMECKTKKRRNCKSSTPN